MQTAVRNQLRVQRYKKNGTNEQKIDFFVYLQHKSKLHYYIMKKVILLFIALWGVISGGINAQSSIAAVMNIWLTS